MIGGTILDKNVVARCCITLKGIVCKTNDRIWVEDMVVG